MTSHAVESGVQTGVLTDVLLPLALAFIMLGMGLTLTGADFRRVRTSPKAVLVGLAGHILLVPILAMVTAVAFHKLLGLEPILVLGLLLLASCPAGATSNLVTFLARADAALSVTVTSVNSLVSAVTTPLIFLATTWLVFGSATVVKVSIVEMITLLAAMIVAPILVGMLVRRRRPEWAARADRPVRILSSVFLALVIAGAIWQNRADFWDLARATVPAALVLNVLALAGGVLLGRAVGLAPFQSRAVAIEAAFQNGTLGIAIATSQLRSPQAAIVPAFYSLTMFLTGALVAWWWARDAARTAARAAPSPAVPADAARAEAPRP